MALAKDRNTVRRSGDKFTRPVKGGVKIYAGALTCVDAGGFAVPGAATSTLRADGRAEAQVDNTAGADGALTVDVFPGIFRWDNSAGGDAITAADIGKTAFVVDDHTVARTSNGGARPVLGEIVDVEAQGVWVDTGDAPALGRTVRLPFFINQTDLLAGTAQYLVSPVDGFISKMSVVVQSAVTTGGPITADVGATPVVGLSCVIANAAVAGTVVSDTPTVGDASTAVAKDASISVIPDAAFATAGAVNGYVEITY